MGALFSALTSPASATSSRPPPPPPLMPPCCVGDYTKFLGVLDSILPPLQSDSESGSEADADAEMKANHSKEKLELLMKTDAQNNNILHAISSCSNIELSHVGSLQILDYLLFAINEVHVSEEERNRVFIDMIKSRNSLGCNVLWIVLGYGNTYLLQRFHDILPKSTFVDLVTGVGGKNEQGDSGILACCSRGNSSTLQLCFELLKQCDKSDVINTALTQPNQKGDTPLTVTISSGSTSTLKIVTDILTSKDNEKAIKELKVSLMQKNKKGLTPIHICSERQNIEMLTTIIEILVSNVMATSEIDDVVKKVCLGRDDNNATPLHIAAYLSNTLSLTCLLELIGKHCTSETTAAIINTVDSGGRTPYYFSCISSHAENAKCTALLEGVGVDRDIPDSYGMTAIDAGVNARVKREENDARRKKEQEDREKNGL